MAPPATEVCSAAEAERALVSPSSERSRVLVCNFALWEPAFIRRCVAGTTRFGVWRRARVTQKSGSVIVSDWNFSSVRRTGE